MLDARFEEAYPLAQRVSRVHSASAAARYGLAASDREDLEQEGVVACWRALARFNPTRASLRTFLECVVAKRVISLHRARSCRPRLQPYSIDQGYASDAWAAAVELRSDVQRVLSRLEEIDRRLAVALTHHTVTEASRIVGISRSTVYERIRRIRVAFADAGLQPQRARRR
jgi:RNA polymerase sigma-70 factor (ECF subfamily)